MTMPVPRITPGEPRLIIFVDDDEVALVRRAVDAGLPETYRGHQVRFFAWQSRTVRHHVEVVTVADWLREQLGALPDELQPAHWLGIPQQRLLQVTAGAVFHDDPGSNLQARRALAWYPRDVWLWLMASQWRIIADQEPLPGRTSEAGDQRRHPLGADEPGPIGDAVVLLTGATLLALHQVVQQGVLRARRRPGARN